MMKDVCILAFTDKGRKTAEKVESGLTDMNIEMYDKSCGAAGGFVESRFRKCDGFIFVGAVGIAVRMIAPYVESKGTDPAVVVLGEDGAYVISVMSGHIGGGNRLTERIAGITGGQAVITTATDINGAFAVDVWAGDNGCVIPELSMIRKISGAVLRGEAVGFDAGTFAIEGQLPQELTSEEADTGISVSLSGNSSRFENTLNVVPVIVTLGVGCHKDGDSENFEKAVLKALEDNNISMTAVERVASVDLKREEKCIIDFCARYRLPFVTYAPEELMATPGNFAHSDFVEKITGADNVCERSCVLASGGRLIMKKTPAEGVTVAAAIRPWKCRF